MRCVCCNSIMVGKPGWIELEDGTKIEEDMCTVCRGVIRDLEYSSDHEHVFQYLTEVQSIICPNGVTPSAKINY